MAYFEQKIMSATAGGTSTDNDIISIVNGAIADSFINKAVTYDGQPADLSNPKVKLASANDIVIGAIIGTSYGKLQIAVGGWDIKFLAVDTDVLTPGSRIVGAQMSATARGYVQAANVSTFNAAAAAGRGAVLYGGPDPGTAGRIIRVTMIFGG